MEPDRLPIEDDLALIRRVNAAQDFHERALAGAVLAEQAMDLAASQREIDAAECDRPAKPLHDAAQLEDH